MTKPGHIEITDKVRFVYHEEEKPNKLYEWVKINKTFAEAMKAYEASKRTIEVSNVFWGDLSEEWFFEEQVLEQDIVRNNQSCKAKVNGKAEIIELL